MNGQRASGRRVVIVGGGMVGVSLALALERRAPALQVTLVESFPLSAPEAGFDARYTPSFDARTTALSYGSRLIYSGWGLWESLAVHAQPIETIHVSERGRFGSTLMQSEDYGWPALGYVVENAWLGNSLLQALLAGRVTTLSPVKVARAETDEAGVRLVLENGEQLDADLLVVADGAQSGLRASLGISHREQRYEQQAVIANVAHRIDHAGRAFERFTPRGPLAMLPLAREPGATRARSALVWTQPAAEAAALLESSDEEFLRRLQRAFGYRLGRLEQVGQRHSYPLALVEAEEQVRSGVVIMGNAAHALHPVAGQGFNLALRDVARLAGCLAEACARDVSPGDLAVLQGYRDAQAADQAQTTAFSDRLPDLFMQPDAAVSALRDLGLFALDMTPGLKREFVRRTAGVAASTEYRDVRP